MVNVTTVKAATDLVLAAAVAANAYATYCVASVHGRRLKTLEDTVDDMDRDVRETKDLAKELKNDFDNLPDLEEMESQINELKEDAERTDVHALAETVEENDSRLDIVEDHVGNIRELDKTHFGDNLVEVVMKLHNRLTVLEHKE